MGNVSRGGGGVLLGEGLGDTNSWYVAVWWGQGRCVVVYIHVMREAVAIAIKMAMPIMVYMKISICLSVVSVKLWWFCGMLLVRILRHAQEAVCHVPPDWRQRFFLEGSLHAQMLLLFCGSHLGEPRAHRQLHSVGSFMVRVMQLVTQVWLMLSHVSTFTGICRIVIVYGSGMHPRSCWMGHRPMQSVVSMWVGVCKTVVLYVVTGGGGMILVTV